MPENSPPTALTRFSVKLITNFAFLLFVAAGAQGQYTVLNQHPVSNRPYPSAYYNQQLPNAGAGGPVTHLMPNSDNIITTIFSTTPTNSIAGNWTNGLGLNDLQHRPLYYGQSTDPVYQVSGCTGAGAFVNGMKFHAPSGAPFSQSDSDEEIVIWDQTTDEMFQFYHYNSQGTLATLATLPACSGTSGSACNYNPGNGYCSAQNRTTGSGVGSGTGASTASIAPFGNIIRFTEIEQVGHINHGLRLLTTCNDTNNGVYPSKVVFPATQSGGSPANSCSAAGVSATNRPPNGTLFFLDYTSAQLDCFNPAKPACSGISKLATWQYMLIEAMTLYGGTIEDTGNGNSLTMSGIESDLSMRFYDAHGYSGAIAQATAWTNYMNTNCSLNCNISPRSNGSVIWQLYPWKGISNVGGTGVLSHLHAADPCVALGLQGLAGGCVSAGPKASTPNAPTGLTATVQ